MITSQHTPHNARPIFLLIVLIACSSLIFAGGVSATEDEAIAPPGLSEHLDELEAVVSDLRGLQPLEPVTRLFPTRDAVRAYLADVIERELTPELVNEAVWFYRAFGFVDGDFDLVSVYAELLGDQVAGYYDTETKEMNTVRITPGELGDELPPVERIIYAHEFTHALQDQYFDLETFLDDDLETDASLAAISLVEGDAMLVMQEYTTVMIQENPGAALAILAFSLSGEGQIPPGTPPILEAELIAPYNDGLNFVTALYRSGGWDAVNAAFDNPPRTMAEIFHPRRYLDGVQPLAVSIAPAGLEDEAGWSLLHEQALGEFYLREYLGTGILRGPAVLAAAGWNGDRYRLYVNDDVDQFAWVLRIAWDTPADRDDFIAALSLYAVGGDREAQPEVLLEADSVVCWPASVADYALCVQDDDDFTTLATAPTADLAAEMIAAQD